MSSEELLLAGWHTSAGTVGPATLLNSKATDSAKLPGMLVHTPQNEPRLNKACKAA